MKKTIFVLVTILTVIQTAKGDEIIAIGWPTGVYKVDSVAGTQQSIGATGFSGLNSLARDVAGRFYSVNSSSNLLMIGPVNGAGSIVATLNLGSVSVNVPSMSFSPSGTLYIVNRNDGDDSLYTVNTNTGFGTLIGPIGINRAIQGLAFAPNGTLYGWDVFIGLVTVNTATGAATDVNASEGASAGIQCLAFAPDGTLYGAQNGLYTIDTATGVPSAISISGLSDIRGMAFNTGPEFRMSIAALDSAVRVCCVTRTNEIYQLQNRISLGTNDWTDLGPQFPGNGSEMCLTNLLSTARKFYRMVRTSP